MYTSVQHTLVYNNTMYNNILQVVNKRACMHAMQWNMIQQKQLKRRSSRSL